MPKLSLQPSLTLEKYKEQFEIIQQNIQYGNIYEMNFCFDFSTQVHGLNCMDVWQKLNTITNAPMSAYFTFDDVSVMCSSPERFIKRELQKLIAQPIKGTAKRSKDSIEDNYIKQQLKENLKEQNENVMIVDLMRNDLSRVATRASVKVDELFGIYSFEQVHQLISTVTCEVKSDKTFTDIIKATFPMGSMTGAPKIEAMKIIEATEPMSRGLYSGCIGYIAPNGDFDLNVVIRSLIYSKESGYLSYCAGSAITALANANEEYNECLLKAKVINQLFSVIEN
jgi:para-aminobenzoate synthetase component 1